MASLTRYEMTGRIIGALREFGTFLQSNKDYFPGNSYMVRHADRNQSIVREETLMQNMLIKLEARALVEMYKNCGVLAEKYDLRAKSSMVGFNSVFSISIRIENDTANNVGNNQERYIALDGMGGVDYDFISRVEGRQQLTGYVPQENGIALGINGVTIATGFDIGQHNEYELNRMFPGPENADLRAAYAPYFLLKRADAITFLAEHELAITQEQASRTDALVMPKKLEEISNRYNTATGGNFDQLPSQAQTVIFSLGFQKGSNGIPVNVLTMINGGNYSNAATAIQNMGQTGHAYRRLQEANLLRQVPDRVAN